MIQGAIAPNHIPVNKYELIVPDVLVTTWVTIGGFEEELETVELPDRTTASGGNTKPFEFNVTIPEHHYLEQVAMEAWFAIAKLALFGYKKAATLILTPVGGGIPVAYSIFGLYPHKRKTSDLEMKNEGEMAITEWSMKCDLIFPG